MIIRAFNLPTRGPADVSGLVALIDAGQIDPARVVCIIGKTEGNGGRNDFTRDLAMKAFEELFMTRLGVSRDELSERMIFSLSGGCEGVMSPHIVVFTKDDDEPRLKASSEKRLALAIGRTRELWPEEIGRMPQIEETARVVRQLIGELRVEPADVHLVQMKGAIPSYSFDEARAAEAAGRPLRSDMIHSRGASALGAALALGEVSREQLSDDVVGRDFSLYSGVASCSAKPGLECTEIMLLANSPHASGELVIDHAVLRDMIDVRAVHELLARLGLPVDVQLTDEQKKRVVGVFAKSEADPRGLIRDRRHTMLTDDDISDTRYSRAVLAAVLASVLGDTGVYVSTRAEHHGPLGGGTVAIVARTAIS